LISTFLFQKVRFAQEQEEKPPEPPKPEMKEVSVWTHEPEYDNYLYKMNLQYKKKSLGVISKANRKLHTL
jgi:hypothetical protein